MQKQNGVRIGSFDGEIEAIVFVQRVAGLDTNLTLVKTVRRIERHELDGRAAVGGNVHGLAFEHLAIQRQRNGSLGGRRVGARDYGLHADLSSDRRSWRAR